LIKSERVYETCKHCGSTKLIKDEGICCDGCRKEIGLGESSNYLLVSAHFSDLNPTVYYHFCSWKCFFKIAEKEIKSDYFVSLPYLNFDEKNKNISAKEFWNCVKKYKARKENGRKRN